ncbi:MAG: 16S rRNA (guanine(527)-N(7))-methyltransferase RsmG [Gammaproteobacteria bacterium]
MQPPHFDPARIARALDAAGRRFGPDEHARLAEYLNLLVKWNAAYNLTGIRDPDALVDRHLVESLELVPLLRGTRIADVGTGAGLPGIPLAIVAPDRHFVLIEIRAKRVRFLRHVVATLGIRNAEIAHTRVEDLRCEHAFDTVLARAVAPPAELAAMTRHLTAPGTVLLLLTASRLREEWREKAAELGLRPVRIDAPGRPGRSAIVMLERI